MFVRVQALGPRDENWDLGGFEVGGLGFRV